VFLPTQSPQQGSLKSDQQAGVTMKQTIAKRRRRIISFIRFDDSTSNASVLRGLLKNLNHLNGPNLEAMHGKI
jgi:hypothetical protein